MGKTHVDILSNTISVPVVVLHQLRLPDIDNVVSI